MIFRQLEQQLRATINLIRALTDAQYLQKIVHLGNASIGQHTRHNIELLQCATNGYSNGFVDYVNRI
jgi:hypothetical protein